MSMFQKRHYIIVAQILKDTKAPKPIIDALCVMFTQDNVSFKEKRFREACKP